MSQQDFQVTVGKRWRVAHSLIESESACVHACTCRFCIHQSLLAYTNVCPFVHVTHYLHPHPLTSVQIIYHRACAYVQRHNCMLPQPPPDSYSEIIILGMSARASVCVPVCLHLDVWGLWCPAFVNEIIWRSMDWQFDLLICVLLAHRESLSYSAAISPGHH